MGEESGEAKPEPSWIYPLAILQSGEQPLWFELAEDGPLLIPSPGEASEDPFTPWPLSRFITGMLVWEGRLVMAVNRSGFLVLAPGDDKDFTGPAQEAVSGGTVLYALLDKPGWDPYTVAAFFLYEGSPAALLYRNDIFADSAAPLPENRFPAIVKGSSRPVALDIPAFREVSAARGWDIEALNRGKRGFWYFRAVKKDSANPATDYYRILGFSAGPELSTAPAFQNSYTPEDTAAAPELLRKVLEEAFSFIRAERRKTRLGEAPLHAKIVSAEFEPSKTFALPSPGGAASLVNLFGYYSPSAALVLDSRGRGVYGFSSQGEEGTAPLLLPALPKGFAYTGAALTPSALVASWEEQSEWNIGAAGFMVIRAPGYSENP